MVPLYLALPEDTPRSPEGGLALSFMFARIWAHGGLAPPLPPAGEGGGAAQERLKAHPGRARRNLVTVRYFAEAGAWAAE